MKKIVAGVLFIIVFIVFSLQGIISFGLVGDKKLPADKPADETKNEWSAEKNEKDKEPNMENMVKQTLDAKFIYEDRVIFPVLEEIFYFEDSWHEALVSLVCLETDETLASYQVPVEDFIDDTKHQEHFLFFAVSQTYYTYDYGKKHGELEYTENDRGKHTRKSTYDVGEKNMEVFTEAHGTIEFEYSYKGNKTYLMEIRKGVDVF